MHCATPGKQMGERMIRYQIYLVSNYMKYDYKYNYYNYSACNDVLNILQKSAVDKFFSRLTYKRDKNQWQQIVDINNFTSIIRHLSIT